MTNISQIMKQAKEMQEKMAEMQKKSISEEADNLEKMPEWKARVLGIRKTDII